MADTQPAVDYYTNRRKEGLDFVLVIQQSNNETDPDATEVVAQAAFREQIAAKLAELGIHHSVDQQIQIWSKWAEEICKAYRLINSWQTGNSHGEHRGLQLSCVCGGVFLRTFARPATPTVSSTCLPRPWNATKSPTAPPRTIST